MSTREEVSAETVELTEELNRWVIAHIDPFGELPPMVERADRILSDLAALPNAEWDDSIRIAVSAMEAVRDAVTAMVEFHEGISDSLLLVWGDLEIATDSLDSPPEIDDDDDEE